MKISKMLAVSILLATTAANAMDVAGVTVNGEVSADYSFFSNNEVIPYSDDAIDSAYRLNKAQLLFKKETEQVSFLARLAYSSVAPVAGSHVANFEQMELFYKFMPNLHIGAGRFLTTMGYESLLKTENAFYNPTIAYQAIIPGYGEGVRVKYVKGEDLTVTLTNMNRTNDPALGEDNNSKATELSANGAFGAVTWFAGYQMGTNNPAVGQRDDRTATSIWATYKLMDNMLVGATYDAKTSKLEDAAMNWSNAFSALVTYKMDRNNFGLRWEHVEGASTLSSGSAATVDYAANKIDSITATDRFNLTENLDAIVELRYDMGDEDTFADADGVANQEKTAWMGTLGVLAHF